MSSLELYTDKIWRDDVLAGLDKLQDNTIHMTFADPPFNLKKSYGNYQDSKELNEYNDWCEKWISEMVRVTKREGSIFVHNLPRWLTYHASFLNKRAQFRHWIAWDAMSIPLGKTLLPNHYGILYYVKNPKEFKFSDLRIPHTRSRSGELMADWGGKKDMIHPFGTLLSDVWTDIHRIKHSTRRDTHPCQLPVPLLERLILMATEDGNMVLDPFMGTGTTAIAAKRLGRHYIGFDIDNNYVELANRKVDRVRVKEWDSYINGCYVSMYLDKINTLRDCDYEKIRPFLQTTKLKINGTRTKELTLPYLKPEFAKRRDYEILQIPEVKEETGIQASV